MKKLLILLLMLVLNVGTAYCEQTVQNDISKTIAEIGYQNSDKGFASAIALGDINAVNKFLDAGFNPNMKIRKLPASFYAVFNEKTDVLDLLLSRGANPDATWGKVSLLTASVELNNNDLVKVLVKNKADINKTAFKVTPLNYAILRKHEAIVSTLLDAGAIPDKKSLRYSKKLKNETLEKNIKIIYEKNKKQ